MLLQLVLIFFTFHITDLWLWVWLSFLKRIIIVFHGSDVMNISASQLPSKWARCPPAIQDQSVRLSEAGNPESLSWFSSLHDTSPSVQYPAPLTEDSSTVCTVSTRQDCVYLAVLCVLGLPYWGQQYCVYCEHSAVLWALGSTVCTRQDCVYSAYLTEGSRTVCTACTWQDCVYSAGLSVLCVLGSILCTQQDCVYCQSRRLFLHSVVSALLGVCLVLVVASYVFIEFFLDPSKLRTDKHFLGEIWLWPLSW